MSYESLVLTASKIVDPGVVEKVDDSNIGFVTNLLDEAAPLLESACQLLSGECRVPVRFEASFLTDMANHHEHLRSLARVFRLQAEVGSRNHDYRTVARSGIHLLDLSNAVRRGGLINDLLVGLCVSGWAVDSLRRSRRHFDDSTRDELIVALKRYEKEREPFEFVAERDHEWEALVEFDEPNKPCEFQLVDPDECGMSEEVQREFWRIIQEEAARPESEKHAKFHDQDRCGIAQTRMLAVDLAVRAWRESHGSLPASLAVLRHQHLPDLPLDPFSDDHFIYRPEDGDSFELYSVGPKRYDASGVFGTPLDVAVGVADLCLDAGDYWPDPN